MIRAKIYHFHSFTTVVEARNSLHRPFQTFRFCGMNLLSHGGKEEAQHKKLEFVIHCTDSDDADCQKLIDGIQDTDLYKNGCIKFGRPRIL